MCELCECEVGKEKIVKGGEGGEGWSLGVGSGDLRTKRGLVCSVLEEERDACGNWKGSLLKGGGEVMSTWQGRRGRQC